MTNNPKIIAIGLNSCPKRDDVALEIQQLGLALTAADDPAALPNLLDRRRPTAVLVYSPDGGDQARQVLANLERHSSRPPVIVLVDHADFGQYYELMHSGASDYYETSEGPAVIARAIRQAIARA